MATARDSISPCICINPSYPRLKSASFTRSTATRYGMEVFSTATGCPPPPEPTLVGTPPKRARKPCSPLSVIKQRKSVCHSSRISDRDSTSAPTLRSDQRARGTNSWTIIVQEFVPLALWSERSVGADVESRSLILEEWQTDFRCFITDKGLQGFLARFGGVPTNVGSGGGGQPVAVLKTSIPYRAAVERVNDALFSLGYEGFIQIQGEMESRAVAMGFTYLRGPIKILIRPRLLTEEHLTELNQYARNLWHDAVKLETLWREGHLDEYVAIGKEERALATMQ